MSTAASRGSSVVSTTGSTWTTTTNAFDGTVGSNPATYAVFTNAASGGVGTIVIGGYTFSGPASDSTINSVSAAIRSLVATANRWTSVTVQLQDSTGANIGSAATATISTSAHTDNLTLGTPTAAQVAAGLRVLVTATHSGTSSSTFSLDQVDLTVTYGVLTATATDSVGITDSVTVAKDYVITVTDTVGIVDNATAGFKNRFPYSFPFQFGPPPSTNYTATPTDSVGITDSTSVDQGRLPVDPVGITDSVTKESGINPTDSVGITDSTSVDQGRLPVDTVGITDSVTKDAGRTVADAVGITDSVIITIDYARTVTDPVGITDSVVKESGINLTDSVGITDSVAKESGINPTDLVGITDSTSQTVDINLSFTDSVGIADSVSTDVVTGEAFSTTDVVGITDSVSLDQTRGATDAVGITDSVIVEIGYNRTVSDTVGIVDSTAKQIDKSVVDPVGILDSTTKDIGANITDTVGITDSTAQVLDYVRTVVDPVGITDLVVTPRDYQRTVSDLIGITDSHTEDFQSGQLMCLVLAPAGAAEIPDNFLQGSLWTGSYAKTVVNYTHTWPSLQYAQEGVDNLNTMIGANIGHHTATNPLRVAGWSMGAEVIYKWMRDYGPTSSYDPNKLLFYSVGNPENPYNGISTLQPSSFPAIYGGLGLPPAAQMKWKMIDISRQFGFFEDCPNNLSDFRVQIAHNAGFALHTDYTGVPSDPNASGNYKYVQSYSGGGTVTWVVNRTYPVPSIQVVSPTDQFGEWLQSILAIIWPAATVAGQDAALRSVMNAAYTTRPMSIP